MKLFMGLALIGGSVTTACGVHSMDKLKEELSWGIHEGNLKTVKNIIKDMRTTQKGQSLSDILNAPYAPFSFLYSAIAQYFKNPSDTMLNIIQVLIEAGANPKYKDGKRYTPLELAQRLRWESLGALSLQSVRRIKLKAKFSHLITVLKTAAS